MTKRKSIAVVGAGIGGLSCAYELEKLGIRVKVFEKDSHVGGRMSSYLHGGLAFDRGAQILGSNYTSAYAYCQELGIAKAWKVSTTQRDYVFRKNALHAFHRFKPSGALSKTAIFRLFMAILHFKWHSRGMDLFDLISADDLSDHSNAYKYVEKIAGREVADIIIDPLFYGNNFYGIEHLSVSTFLSAFKFGLCDVQRYCHLEEKGIGLLPAKLAEKLNVAYSSPVEQVQWTGEQVEISTATGKEMFDAAVLALPTTQVKKIYVHPSPMQSALLGETHYSTTITVALLVPAQAIAPISMGFVPAMESSVIASFVAQTMKGKAATQNGKGLLNIFVRDGCAKAMMEYGDEAIFEIVRPECLRICPALQKFKHEVESYALKRWPEAIPLIPSGFVSKVKEFWQHGQGENRIYLCGDFLASPYVEGSIRCGQKVASALSTFLSTLE